MRLLSTKEPYRTSFLFILKTVVFYLVFNYSFVAYTGVTIAGGRFYSPFLAEHFDFISWFRDLLLWGGSQFTSLVGYPSYYFDNHLVVREGASVRLVYSCLGLDLISAYVALVLAWPAHWRSKIISSLFGTVIIILFNMIRLGGLAVLYSTDNYRYFDYIDHHELFNVLVLLMVFVMFIVHVRKS